jgi:hypothetical protein
VQRCLKQLIKKRSRRDPDYFGRTPVVSGAIFDPRRCRIASRGLWSRSGNAGPALDEPEQLKYIIKPETPLRYELHTHPSEIYNRFEMLFRFDFKMYAKQPRRGLRLNVAEVIANQTTCRRPDRDGLRRRLLVSTGLCHCGVLGGGSSF